MRRKNTYMAFIICLFLYSCSSEWLEVKKDQKLVVPKTLSDLQALMDNTSVFNFAKSPSIGEISSDDIFITDNEWLSTSSLWQKNAYIWESDIFQGIPSSSNGWDLPYRQVFYSNVVLEGLDKISPTEKNTSQYKEIQGTALFWRSWAFYQLIQIFCKQYDAKDALSELGIPLPLESDVNTQHTRATLEQSYNQILRDLEVAYLLLPSQKQFPTQPSKSGASGLLARIYLQKADYANSYRYASLSFSESNGLMDYNDIIAGDDYSFEQFNKEVILENSMEHYSSGILSYSKLLVHPYLFQNYKKGDLRKTLFFDSGYSENRFKGSYSGTQFLFSGISSNEIFLIKMESAFRIGNYSEALDLFNFLIKLRTAPQFYRAKENITLEDILLQRRLELPFRGIRWTDIKRLNLEGFSIELNREVFNKKYTLGRNSNKFALQIPPEVIKINPGIIQNER